MPDSFSDTLSVLFALVGVIAIIVFMFWAARWFQKKYGFGFNGNNKLINIKDTVSITPDSRLIIAEVDGKRYLIGVGNVRMLGELAETGATEVGETKDVETAEAGTAEAGTAEAGTAEAGTAEAGTAEAGTAEAGTAEAGKDDEQTGKKSIFTRSEKIPLGEAFKIVLAEKLSAKKEDE